MRSRGLVALLVAVAVSVVPAALAAAAPQLFGTVRPDFSITLEDAGGAPVTKIDPGAYEIQVRDLADFHNFRLTGPGVAMATGVETTGTVTWSVTFRDGIYTLLCDVHPSSMRRTFISGTPPAATPRLLATVGPGNTISLRSASGATLKQLKPATYSIAVRDRSKLHNFHLVGKGVNRKSGLAATGTVTWKLKLSAGTLRFFSDRSPKTVKGSVLVR